MQHIVLEKNENSAQLENVTYSLKASGKANFYKQLWVFTDKMIQEAEFFLNKDILTLTAFFSEEFPEKNRHPHEYIIEYLALGTYLNYYGAYAVNSGKLSTSGVAYLHSLRKKSQTLKPIVDNVRGVLSAHLLYQKTNERFSYTRETVFKLLSWMKATGEFKEECERLSNWAFYFSTLDDAYVVAFLARCVSFSKYFEEQAKAFLGDYTKGVGDFLKNEHPAYKYREDFLFCGRSEAEYHLNMFGAEILNRNLKPAFDKTEKKVLLLPTCMAKPKDTCKASSNKNYLSCTGCSANCHVNQIRKSMLEKGVETCLIPHSSSFSVFLKNWENQDKVGLIGVACVLNLLTGGYEMQRLNIPSQCVFLDYSGCKKHWNVKGIPTDINIDQLNHILKPVNKESIATIV